MVHTGRNHNILCFVVRYLPSAGAADRQVQASNQRRQRLFGPTVEPL